MAWLRGTLRAVTRAFFRLFYELDITGLENIPLEGPTIIAANHVNYFDAPLLLAFAPRPMYFIAASTGFKVPVWRFIMNLYGVIPVERGKADASAIKAAIRLLGNGQVLGIFPEGTFTQDGHTVPAKLGTAHIAMKTGSPIVPVTISGAFHSWPRLGPAKRKIPRPWRIRIKFHEPIEVAAGQPDEHKRDKKAAEELTEQIMKAVNQTLEPAIRAEAKIDELIAAPASRIRLYELFPLFLSLAAALLLGMGTRWFTEPVTSPAAARLLTGFFSVGLAYFLYLAIDTKASRQTALKRAIRSFSPFLFLLLYYPLLVRAVPLAAEVRQAQAAAYPQWLSGVSRPLSWILVDWLFLAYFSFVPYLLLSVRYYHFHKYLHFQRFVRGVLLCTYAALLSILFAPSVGGMFPPAITFEEIGLLSPLVSRAHVSRLVLASFPTVIVTLTIYCLAFDLYHHRRSFLAFLLPSLSGLLSASLLRGYPLRAVGFNLLTVIAVLLYMRLFPITAHDGRKV